ncbi:MAG: ketoacyl-ACP synthase III [Candidatus Manganitrophus sp. SB1]|nr:ketoacyl-ACP synthase III [Candidatus Manganitrophus morganii]
MPSQIIGTGIALPKRAVTNEELSGRLGLSEKKIEKMTGIQSRHWVEAGETTSSLAVEAARKALQSADLLPDAIDLILVSTTSPDMSFPSTACLVQRALSTRPIPALDLNASCSGFLYALSVGDQFIRSGTAKRVLIIAAEVKSPSINPGDPSTAILFGDGAAAVVLAEGKRGIQLIRLHADGSRHRLISLPAGGSRYPTTSETLSGGLHYIRMEGKGLFRMAVKRMQEALFSLAKEANLSLSEIDFFIFHQANLRILETVFEKTGIPHDKSVVTIPRYGNTSSSSLPIALDEATRTGKLKPGNRVILCAFGGGLTWGTALIEW